MASPIRARDSAGGNGNTENINPNIETKQKHNGGIVNFHKQHQTSFE